MGCKAFNGLNIMCSTSHKYLVPQLYVMARLCTNILYLSCTSWQDCAPISCTSAVRTVPQLYGMARLCTNILYLSCTYCTSTVRHDKIVHQYLVPQLYVMARLCTNISYLSCTYWPDCAPISRILAIRPGQIVQPFLVLQFSSAVTRVLSYHHCTFI